MMFLRYVVVLFFENSLFKSGVKQDDNDDRPRVPKSQRLENQDESDNKVSGTVLPKGILHILNIILHLITLVTGWSIHTTEEGYEYYFHAETGKSQWHAPS